MATFPGIPPNPLGLKCELYLNSVWTDITPWLMIRDQVKISGAGRSDESQSLAPSQMTLTLKNADGRFTPANAAGAYYPYIQRNTQIRVSVNATSATGVPYSGYRFWGEVSSWPPASDISQRDQSVSITAAGIWRRISQAQWTLGSAYSRYVKLLTGGSVPAAYWSMEDGSGSKTFVLTEGTGTSATLSGTPSFAADSSSFAGSDALPQFNSARIGLGVSGFSGSSNVIRFMLSVPAGGDSSAGGVQWNIIEVDTSGTVAYFQAFLNPSGTLYVEGRNSGLSVLFSGTTTTNVQGTPYLVSMELTGTVSWALRLIAPGAGAVHESVTGSVGGSTGNVTNVKLNRSGVLSDTTAGQVTVHGTVPSLTAAAAAAGGNAGELAATRFLRVCGEENVAAEVTGSGGAAMGPQADDTLQNVLQMIENTDGGVLYETTDQLGLGYRTLASMKDQASPVVLNYAAGVLGAPLTPTFDDQLLVNSWQVANTDGYTVLAKLVSGALSVQPPPNGAGSGYSKQLTISAASDSQANTIATQRLFEGTVNDVRYPTVTVNFQRALAGPLFASVPGLRIGDYLQITNLPAVQAGGGTSKQLAWGRSEVIGGSPQTWAITLNTIPELPFESSFSPGTYTVTQVPGGTATGGTAAGGTISGSQIAPGSITPGQLQGSISARGIGGMTSFISAAVPYDWSFAVSGTPADGTYFTCTPVQANPIAIGDSFTNSGGLGGPFTVTQVTQQSPTLTWVYFTPTAASVMSSGTVYGGKNGDTWINTSAGNQVNVWAAGAWTPVTWNAANVIQAASITSALITAGTITAGNIAAGTITAGLLAAGIVVGGIVDGTVVKAAEFRGGNYFGYTGASPSANTLVVSLVPGTNTATDSAGNIALPGAFTYGSDGSSYYAAGTAFQSGYGGMLQFWSASSESAGWSQGPSLYAGNYQVIRQVTAQGGDNPLDRTSTDLSTYTNTNQTVATTQSGTFTIAPNEAQAGSIYLLEFSGYGNTATSSPQILWVQLSFNGTAVSAIPIGSAGGLGTNQPIAFEGVYRISVVSTGSGGSANVNGRLLIGFNGATSRTDTNAITGLSATQAHAYNTTVSNQFVVQSYWASGAAGQTITTYESCMTKKGK